MNYKILTRCRICQSDKLELVLDLREQPLANKLLSNPNEKYLTYPLQLMFCKGCRHGQLSIVVDPTTLFAGNYPFLAGQSATWRTHCQALARTFGRPHIKVLDIGANDGTLLQEFGQYNLDTIVGVEPSAVEGPYKKVRAFWNPETAKYVVDKYGQFDLIMATNVFAHVDEPYKFLDAVSMALKPGGKFVFEVPNLVNLIRECQYDTIYHEHLSYFSWSSLYRMVAKRYDLFLVKAERVQIHGGSILVVLSNLRVQPVFPSFIEDHRCIVDNIFHFDEKVASENFNIADTLSTTFGSVYGYGASAKACVRLNYGKTWSDRLICVFDDALSKIGKWIPGVNLPIISPSLIKEVQPDVIIPLSRNIADELEAKARDYGFKGRIVKI